MLRFSQFTENKKKPIEGFRTVPIHSKDEKAKRTGGKIWRTLKGLFQYKTLDHGKPGRTATAGGGRITGLPTLGPGTPPIGVKVNPAPVPQKSPKK